MRLRFKPTIDGRSSVAQHTTGVNVICADHKLVGIHDVMFTGYSKTVAQNGLPTTVFCLPVDTDALIVSSEKGFTRRNTKSTKAYCKDADNNTRFVGCGRLERFLYIANHLETENDPTIGGIYYILPQPKKQNVCVGVETLTAFTPFAQASKQYLDKYNSVKPKRGDILTHAVTRNIIVVDSVSNDDQFMFTGRAVNGALVPNCCILSYERTPIGG